MKKKIAANPKFNEAWEDFQRSQTNILMAAHTDSECNAAASYEKSIDATIRKLNVLKEVDAFVDGDAIDDKEYEIEIHRLYEQLNN